MTLEELLLECNKDVPAETVAAPSKPVDLFALPFWVVAVNLRRVPRKPKFVASFDSYDDAETDRNFRSLESELMVRGYPHESVVAMSMDERYAAFNDAVASGVEPHHKPFQFFVIDRPKGGTL